MNQQIGNNIGRYELLFCFLWLIIIAPKPIQLIIFIILVPFLWNKRKIQMNFIAYTLIFYIVFYSFSIFYNVIYFEHETERIFSAINNIILWVLGLLFYLIYKTSPINKNRIIKFTFYNFLILFLLYIVSLFLYYIMNIQSLNIYGNNLFSITWFDNTNAVRFTGLMDYANLVVMFYFILFPLFLAHLVKLKSKLLKLLLLALSLFTIIATLSRSGYILIAVAAVISLLVYLIKKNRNYVFFSIAFFMLSMFVLLIFYTPLPHYFFQQLNELLASRDGSTTTRTSIIMDSINITNNNSLLLGMGIKELSPYDGLPYGSHSTYVGFFYKTGSVGLVIGLSIFIALFLKNISKFLGSSIIRKNLIIFSTIMLALFFVEDIDGANWLIVLYFTINGIIQNDENWRE